MTLHPDCEMSLIALHAERAISMTLRVLGEIQQHLGIDTHQDPALLRHMQSDLDARRLVNNLRRDLRSSEGDDTATAP